MVFSALLVLLVAVPCRAEPQQESILAPMASNSLIVAGDASPPLAVLVGERGHLLRSEDQGFHWTQVRTPTRRLLTAVEIVDPDHIWVVGHDAIIMNSSDQGRTWQVQYEDPEEEAPLFDVWFENVDHGVAIGAYGLFLETHDGGRTWQQRAAVDSDAHLYSITEAGDGDLFIAGESGTILRSQDRGMTWQELESPYGGSFFGVLALHQGAVLVFGLRGNLFRSDDQGETWTRATLQSQATLLGGAQSAKGTIALVGLSGAVYLSDGSGVEFHDRSRKERVALANALFIQNERLLLMGESGLLWYEDQGEAIPLAGESGSR